jgi:hypothetical protein
MTRSEKAGHGRIFDRHEHIRVCPDLADYVDLYRDLYMPQRAKK